MLPQESVGSYRELGYWYSAPNIKAHPLTRASCLWLHVAQVRNLNFTGKNWNSKPLIPLDPHEQTPEIFYPPGFDRSYSLLSSTLALV